MSAPISIGNWATESTFAMLLVVPQLLHSLEFCLPGFTVYLSLKLKERRIPSVLGSTLICRRAHDENLAEQ